MQSNLVEVKTTGWRLGLTNLMKHELKQWFGTKNWLNQAVMWSFILGGVSLLFLGIPGEDTDLIELRETGLMLYSIFGTIFPSIAIVIFSTSSMLEDKDKGTAAWVLTKPVSRTAFILAKLISGTISYLVSIVLIPGLVVYLALNAITGGPALLPFLIGLSPMLIWYMFIHFLCICLGSFFNEAGPVAGPASISLFFVNAFDLSGLGAFTPWTLSFVARDLMMGVPVSSYYPVVSTCAILLLLAVLAIWRFDREEF